MPEYLTPAVYVEETSFRARSIEGVATSTFGMAGVTRYGPVSYKLDATDWVVVPPPLITSYNEFERAFGGLGDVDGDLNYLGYAARAFFANGGRRLYVSRVFYFPRDPATHAVDPKKLALCFASLDVGKAPTGPGAAPVVLPSWRARWPGIAGQEIRIDVAVRRSSNVLVGTVADNTRRLSTVREFDLVELADNVPAANAAVDPTKVRLVQVVGGKFKLAADGGTADLPATGMAFQLQLQVTVTWGSRTDVYTELAVYPEHPRAVSRALGLRDGADSLALVWLKLPDPGKTPIADAANLLANLVSTSGFLTGGSEGATRNSVDYEGLEVDDDDPTNGPTGLNALTDIDDIAIVAMPDSVRFGMSDTSAVQALIDHAENQRYRIAVVDPPGDLSISAVRQFRANFDSRYAALYYPWVEIVDPNAVADPGAPPPILKLPPSGYAAGIYARSDIERGVFKAPANEVIRGIQRFATNVTFDRQSVLNPEGINALRFFSGRSNRVWGARTMSSDPEWKYVNVRRLFIFLEHSIDKATQFAVFEPNNDRLWTSIRRSVEDFLFIQWRSGALLGARPEDAYFVRCDRSTMSQNDLDNGRMICLVGVAPTYPAEFVIFRIGQWTADSQNA